MNAHCILGLLATATLAACTASATKAIDRPATVVAADAVDSETQLAGALKLVSQKEWPQALAALRAIVDARTFRSLPSEVQYRVLSTASRVAIYHGSANLGYGYLARVTAMPQAGYQDWWERLREAYQTHNKTDTVTALTVMMQRWPDRSAKLDPDIIQSVVNQANELPGDSAFPLFLALFSAHWTPKWGIEPSTVWGDLALLLLDKDRNAEAQDVAGHVTNVYVLIAMRADRRFDAVVAANPAHFDIDEAMERELHARQTAADMTPRSLELKARVIEFLLHRQHYEAALAASDSLLLDIRSTNSPEKLYEDYNEKRSWFLDLRATALERVGRWEEAVAQLTAASLLNEKYSGNVDQLIDLGDLYCELERPRDALRTIGSLVAPTSLFGAMQLEAVRLEAAEQLRDIQQVRRSLDYMRLHHADAPPTYVASLVAVNQLAQAARVLIGELIDKRQRQAALLSVQGFAPTPGTSRDMEFEARWQNVISRSDVRAAIAKVGRVDRYRVEAP